MRRAFLPLLLGGCLASPPQGSSGGDGGTGEDADGAASSCESPGELADGFDGLLDPEVWDRFYRDIGCVVEAANGRLEFINRDAGSECGVRSVACLDLRDGVVAVDASGVGNGLPGLALQVVLADGEVMRIHSTSVTAEHVLRVEWLSHGGPLYEDDFQPELNVRWRIAARAGSLVFETSPAATEWTELASQEVTDQELAGVHVELICTSMGDVSDEVVSLDDLAGAAALL